MSRYMWKGLTLKSVNKIERAGKSPLLFVDLIDPLTFETSGEYLYMPTDRNEELPAVGTIVDVYTKPGMYNNRATITFASVKASSGVSKAS